MDDEITLLPEMSDEGIGEKALALIAEPIFESFLVLELRRDQNGYLLDRLEKDIEMPPEDVRLMVVLLEHMDPIVGFLESVQRRFESVEGSGASCHRLICYF